MRQFGIVALLFCSLAKGADKVPEPLDGIHRTFQDALLDRMVGHWELTGNDPPSKGRPPYEALVFIGYYNTSERYVAHWTDVFGGRYSETLGFGRPEGNSVKFLFE